MDKNLKKIIIISAVNFRAGGPLSVLQDCLSYAHKHLSSHYQVIALVHKAELFHDVDNIKFIEFPKSASSYLYRLYYEYFYFKRVSLQYNPFLWLSLHDMTPNVQAKVRAVYCHNPSPFYNITLKEFYLEPTFALFNFFYKYLYAINIKKNQFVIVQQEWLRKKFKSMYGIKNIIVAHPEIIFKPQEIPNELHKKEIYHFFFPTLPRIFKNIELICEAVKILNNKKISNFELALTLDGTENRYAQSLVNNYKNIKNINFIGKQPRNQVFAIYQHTDCLIFPSKLETWGMPITEFKNFNKPILVADLQYAHETVGSYKKIKFFNPTDSYDLANKMEQALTSNIVFDAPKVVPISFPYTENWDGLFKILLKTNHE